MLEPANPFVPGWHIEAICTHLEAISTGQIRRLLINMPPRHAKSLIVAVFWPVWAWATTPEKRFLFTSYSEALSVRDSIRCRNLILSPWFQHYWGHRFTLRRDQNAKKRFDNSRMGYRIASSVSGLGTGEGGDVIVADDPNNVKEAESEAARQEVLIWWDEVMSSRISDPRSGAFVVVQQRTHEEDLSGHILAKGGYEHLMLPARYDPTRTTTTALGPYERRTEDGALLWPARFGAAEIAALARDMGPYAAAGQLDQNPVPRGGGLFKRDWWNYYDPKTLALAEAERVIQVWDTAFSEKTTADYSVCATWARYPTGFYLVDIYRERVEFPVLKAMAVELYLRWRPGQVLIEQKASGISLIQELRTGTPELLARGQRMPIVPVVVLASEDKLSRATSITPHVAAHLCWLPTGAAFVDPFVEEHANFPKGAKKDQVDTTVMAIRHLAGGTVGYGPWDEDEEEVVPDAVDEVTQRRPVLPTEEEDREEADIAALLLRRPTPLGPGAPPPPPLDFSHSLFPPRRPR